MFQTVRQKILLFFIATGIVLCALCIVLWMALLNARSIYVAQDNRLESMQLADEIRRSTDDLTRMVRTYIVTGDSRFKQYYEDIVAIREGRLARPRDYNSMYWDIVSATHQQLQFDGEQVALTVRMQQLGFTSEELAKLAESKHRSDRLIEMEIQAMNALMGQYKNGQGEFSRLGRPNQELARNIVHGPTYHRERADSLRPLHEFITMVESRTQGELMRVEQQQDFLLSLAGGLSVLLLLLCVVGYIHAKDLIVNPLRALTGAVRQMESGDYRFNLATHRSDELGVLSRAFVSLSLLIESQLEELRYKADHDPLTGALTRQAAEDRLEYCLRSARRTGSSLGVLFLDINDFKQTNDTWGHMLGDRVLCAIAERSADVLRETDFVCRLGGDEFMIILTNLEQDDDLERVCRKLDAAFARPLEHGDQFLGFSVSIGRAIYPKHGNSVQELIRQADINMYSRKKQRARKRALPEPAG